MARSPISVAASGSPPAKSFYEQMVDRLSPTDMARLDSLFEAYEFTGSAGHKYKVGTVIRTAWQAEYQIPDTRADEAAAFVASILQSASMSAYAVPACCSHHRDVFVRSFSSPLLYPDDEVMLKALAEATWAVLPSIRRLVDVKASSKKTMVMSKFMTLREFILRHDHDVIARGGDLDETVDEFVGEYSAKRDPAVRRSDLRGRIASNRLIGLIGGYPSPSGRGKPPPTYCTEGTTFATPSLFIRSIDRVNTPPDEVLRQLGTYFDADATFVELVFDVVANVGGGPTVPTVSDAQGYWLFRPDRSTYRSGGLTWNHTRNLATDGRGLRELITPALPIGMLRDLVVWTEPSAADWVAGATDSLSTNLLAP